MTPKGLWHCATSYDVIWRPLTAKNVHFSGIPALCLSSTSETTMRKATSTNFMVSHRWVAAQMKTFWPTRQTRPVPTAVQEGLYKWGNGEEEHPAEVDRYVSCYGLCDWRGGEETKNGLALNDLLSWRLFLIQVELYINGAKSPQKNKKPIERPEDHAGLVLTFFHKLYFYEFWIVSESLWWSVWGTTTMTRLHWLER